MVPTEKKIFLDKFDRVETAVDRVIEAPTTRIILNIPRDSVLGASVSYFHILKRESETARKELFIESVDDHILELASLAKLSATNPIWKKRERAVSDILPRPLLSKIRSDRIEERDEISKPILGTVPWRKREEQKIASQESRESPPFLREERKKRRKMFLFKVLFALLLLGGAGYFIVVRVLPQATIVLSLETYPATFRDAVVLSTKISQPIWTGNTLQVPAELLRATRNLGMAFVAHGTDRVETKAKGTLTIYNAFSSEAQVLVQGTRFESPTKHIFRLDQRVTVPGAKIQDGKILPSQIEVAVTADAPGEEYNLAPSTEWKIPGFAGTPRYHGFYAEAKKAFSGGFVGERPVPTKEDLENIRASLAQSLQDALKSQMAILLANNEFTLLDGASSFSMDRFEVQPPSQASTTFTAVGEASMRSMVFKETMLKQAIRERLAKSLPQNIRPKTFEISYGEPVFQWDKETASLPVNASIVFEPDIDAHVVASNVLGLDEITLQKAITAIPGLKKANISLWPFWVHRVPNTMGKVKVTIE